MESCTWWDGKNGWTLALEDWSVALWGEDLGLNKWKFLDVSSPCKVFTPRWTPPHPKSHYLIQ